MNQQKKQQLKNDYETWFRKTGVCLVTSGSTKIRIKEERKTLATYDIRKDKVVYMSPSCNHFLTINKTV